MKKILFLMVWLLTYNTLSAQNQLISAEYYFGTTDPGQGLALPLTVSDGAFDEAVESVFSDSVLIALADSNFILNVRVKDQNGLWGPVFTKAMHWSPLTAGVASSISVLQMNDMHITAGEYFLGMSDPGDGNATPILALDGNFNEAVESLFRSNMVWNNLPSPTLFNIRVRDINGVWGPLFKKAIMPSGTRVSANLIAQGDTLHICENLAITLTYAGPNGFSKQWFDNATTDSISFIPAQTGYYTLSAQQGNELYTDSIYVIIHPIAASIISADTLRFCASSYTLQADTGSYTYLWNTGAINTTTLAITQSGWYTCTYANISCSRKDSVYISLLNAQIQQNDTTICPGSTISLSATNTVNGLSFFYSSGFDGSTVSNWSNVKRFSFDGSQVMGPYSNEMVSYQSSTLPTHDSLQIEFDFYPHDTWDNGEPFQFVLDGNVLSTVYFDNLNGTVSDTRFQSAGIVNNRCLNLNPYYTKKYHATFRVPHMQATTQFYINQWAGEDVCNESWSFDNFKISYRAPMQYTWSTGATGAQTSVSPNAQTMYTVTLSDGVGFCTDSVQVIVHSVPGNFIAADSMRVCGNEQLLDAGPGYVSYLWSTGDTSQTIQVNQTGMYSCTVSNEHCASTDSVFVSLVDMAVLTNDTTICTGTSLQLEAASNSSYQTISWSSGGSAQTEWVTPLQNTRYYCTASNAYQTCTDSVLVNVSMPVTALQATPSAVLCVDDSLRLEGSGALSYVWSNGVQDGISFVPTATATYTVTGSDVFGCSSTQTVTVVVNPRPSVGVVSTNTFFCYGVSTVLNASGATSYTWLPSTGLNASNLSSVTATPLQSTTYTVTGSNNYGCTSTADIMLTVKPQPIVTPIGNQNYCNGQSVSAVLLSGSPANVSFDISGGASRGMPNQTNVFGLPAFTAGPTGSALVTILPKANGCVGNAYTYTMNVTNCNPVTLNAKFYLQGYYIGSGLMERVLYNQGAIGSASIPNCDYVVVELHATTPPYGVVKTSLATLKTNGTLQCSFQGSVTNNSYYIVINHRNTILTWSSQPVTMSAITNYDFSTASSKAYGNNQVLLEPGIWGFYSADINQDENIDLLDMSLLDIDNMNFEYGYLATDINGDGNVDLLDYPITDLNISNFVYSVHP
jgi:hypothetical protein